MDKKLLTICLFFFLFCGLHAQSYEVGKTYFGKNDYVQYRAGNIPIIITAPHGGRLKPEGIPDRKCAGCVVEMDANTKELAWQIDSALQIEFGGLPHIIVNELHRSKFDANRDIDDAADGNAAVEISFHEWHQFIQAAKDDIKARFGKGLLIDLHGHGHAVQRLEIGYLLQDDDWRKSDKTLDTPQYFKRTGIKNLILHNVDSLSGSEMLRGAFALGTLLAVNGYPAVPSVQDPAPQKEETYFDGGYNTQRHGSRDSTTIDAIQIECNNKGVRNSYVLRRAFATKLALVLKTYLKKHYFPTMTPVSLAAFTVKPIDSTQAKGNRLTWKTYSEVRMSGFDIQRSTDGKVFSKWKTVESKALGGNSNTPLEYTIDDETPLSKTTIYRLKLKEISGKFIFSPMVTVESPTK
ncbi:MAG: hypothetical protein JNL70_02295 [Saprospiraceae bacterium]|nr:hypothetical protein [Saprospiraceae bacterium]